MMHLKTVTLFCVVAVGLLALCGCDQTKAIPLGIDVPKESALLSFTGWSEAEEEHRWSDSKLSSISFFMDRGTDAKKLLLTGWSLGPQSLVIRLNGKIIFSGQADGSIQTIVVDVPAALLSEGKNDLAFEFPDARRPGTADQRELGFALRTLRFE
jgi:hypothetical protein